MSIKGLNIGLAITGSFCTFSKVLPEAEKLVEEKANVIPIFSYNAATIDTRFGSAKEWIMKFEDITGNKSILDIASAEPVGPKKMFDILVIAPCTGNTLSKLANAITDTPVLMAAKSHLRNGRPIVLGISTNDALGANAKNLGILLNSENYYFIPFGQDNAFEKRNSLVAKMDLMIQTIEMAIQGKQLQPIMIEY